MHSRKGNPQSSSSGVCTLDLYEGAWRSDRRHGVGSLRLGGSGDLYEGEWKEGKVRATGYVQAHHVVFNMGS
jgi:hypothetical protein